MMTGIAAWLRGAAAAWRDFPLREDTVAGGRYRLHAPVGEGSYGQAYRGTDLQTGRAVIVKVSKPSKGELGRRLLQRESAVMARLRHRQIPARIDEFRIGRREALVMELCEGRNLEQIVLEDGRTFGEREALRLLRALSEPVIHLHEAGFVHRDIRIPNVLVQGESVSLIDFGLACGIGEQLPRELQEGLGDVGGGSAGRGGRVRGRPRPTSGQGTWGAVKRLMRAPAVGSDLYGMGHLLLFLLYSGYESTDARERGWEEELALREGTRALIRRLLAGEPQPFASARELADATDRLLAGPADDSAPQRRPNH